MTRFVAGPIKPEPEPTVISIEQDGDGVRVMAKRGDIQQCIGMITNEGMFVRTRMAVGAASDMGIKLSPDSPVIRTV